MTPSSTSTEPTLQRAAKAPGPMIWLVDAGLSRESTKHGTRAHSLGVEQWIPEDSHKSAPIAQKSGHEKRGVPDLGLKLQMFSQQHPDRDLLITSCDFPIEAKVLETLQLNLKRQGGALALTVLSNRDPRFNPFHKLEGIGAREVPSPVQLVSTLATSHLFPANHWPDHLVYLNSAAIRMLGTKGVLAETALSQLQDNGGQLLLNDSLFVYDPECELITHALLENHEQALPPAWGQLSSRLSDWLANGTQPRASAGAGSPVTTLHITHSWGGGVGRWVDNFIATDIRGRHLQLRSESAESGLGAGQRLALYEGNESRTPLATWWLHPIIRSSIDQHPFYPQILQDICQRYGVGRVMVSSLVGHSLDALRSGLPTLQVLHDYYPLWPLLGINPEPYLARTGNDQADASTSALSKAMSDHKLLKDFGNRSAEGWQQLAARWVQTLDQQSVRLVAPSRSVARLLGRLDPAWQGKEIRLIPHGSPPFKDTAPIEPKARKDGRLRVVIPGRMQQGKGQALLLQALPGLTKLAQVYLLGTGKEGEAFFGISGVNVILQYEREELPALLREIGPHFAALLSVVPETFSYTLSEMRQLGVPIVATRVGSLAERIEDGINGFLIEPGPRQLLDKVRQIHQQPDILQSLRKNAAQEEVSSPGEMLQQYLEYCPAEEADLAVAETASLDQLDTGTLAWQAAGMGQEIRQLTARIEELQGEVDKRTEWARQRESALQAEQKNREQWVSRLQEEIASGHAALAHERSNLLQAKSVHDALQTQYAALHAQYDTVLASSSWRLTKPLRAARRVLANLGRARAWNPLKWPLLLSQAVRTISTSGLRGAIMRAQLAPQENTDPDYERGYSLEGIGDPEPPARLPLADNPVASIIIPVYNKWEYTAACLRSLASTHNKASFEVIVVDDGSKDETADRAQSVSGLKYIRNSKNLGFVGSCNRGLEMASGEFTVLLNNDTQVLDGWLDALLETFERFPDTGLAGAQLIYPDGSLQEAGGIIFRDGSGWNYGRNDKAEKPEYQYVREVDYCSGACIALRTSLFRKLEGFDSRYAPAYYEDTDLAFRVREAGLKVRYQPGARIIHHEGVTSGTDINSGAKRYQDVNRNKFLKRWEQELSSYPGPIVNPDDQRQVRAARDHRLKGRVLIIDAYTPEPDQDSGSLRLCYLFECFQQLGYGVSFFADNRGFAGHYSEALQATGVEVLYNPWIASLQDFFRERGPEFDYVLVSRHYVAANYLSLVRKYCPQAKFLFDTVDLHYLREQRLAELENSLPLQRVAAQSKRSELAVIRQSDATLVVSPVEQAVLAKELPGARVDVLSNIHRVDGCQAAFEDRKDLFFVGGYQHPPNIDAAQWFVTSIWPLVREQLPGVQFHLIGSKAPERIKSLHGNGVVFHGFVDRLEPWIDGCRLAVAPLRYGAGVKGKVNISMSRGQPVVATPAAVEGLQARDGEDVLVADNAEEFAAAIVRLYQDRDLWEKLSRGGLENVAQYFSLETARNNLAELLESLDTQGNS